MSWPGNVSHRRDRRGDALEHVPDENGWNKAGTIAAMAPRPFTALFCVNDVLAMATLSRLQQAGIRVPLDRSVLGYDDAELAAYTAPTLSTVRIPSAAVAVNACRHLMNLCYSYVLEVQRSFVSEVVSRRSVAPGPHPPITDATRSPGIASLASRAHPQPTSVVPR